MVAINRYEWPIFYWKKNKQKKLVQIDSMGNTITDENQIIKLKKHNGKVITVPISKRYVEEDTGVEFSIKSWIRNEALNSVGREIRSMKKKAYEYNDDQLMEMIKEEEKKIIKKKGITAIKLIAMSTLGISFIPGL